MSDRRYEFILKDGPTVLKFSMDADINIWELKDNLNGFLIASGWQSETLDKLWGVEDE